MNPRVFELAKVNVEKSPEPEVKTEPKKIAQNVPNRQPQTTVRRVPKTQAQPVSQTRLKQAQGEVPRRKVVKSDDTTLED